MDISMIIQGNVRNLCRAWLVAPTVSQHRTISNDSKQISSNSNGAKTRKRKKMIDRMVRVDHAGEYGADRIYAGQLFVLGRTDIGPVIKHMWEQEKAHLKKFDEYMFKYRARPTVLLPFWNAAGFVLGAGMFIYFKTDPSTQTLNTDLNVWTTLVSHLCM